MKIKSEYVGRYLYDIATQQIADEYREKGYSMSFKEDIGDVTADIVARKDEEVIVIEVKAGKLSSERKQDIARLSNYIKQFGNYKFLVVFVNPPQEKRLGIENFEELLLNYFQNNLPNELSKLSPKTELEGFEYINIDEITVQDAQILVKGEGVVNVNLQYGEESKDGLVVKDSYPFNIDISLEYTKENKLKISNVHDLKVDTTSFYE